MSEEIKLEDMYEPEWTERVMSMLTDKEKVDGKLPRVNGLRRIAQKILGPIVSNKVLEVAPSTNAEQRSTVVVEIMLHNKFLDEIVVQGGVAECNQLNGKGFEIHASSVSQSKAEAVALRKLLCLDIVTFEEMGGTENKTDDAPIDMDSENETLSNSQRILIETLCGRVGVALNKVFNDKMTPKEAKELIGKLNEWQQSEQGAPEELRW